MLYVQQMCVKIETVHKGMIQDFTAHFLICATTIEIIWKSLQQNDFLLKSNVGKDEK